ncbi:carbamoyltransferase C-terminal domain-containing protein (plasmid) [Azospirillum melinis]|uniref:carbamoyltransferase C-terminal domain-containing protein n=1 Tax=Azospirillum melinis TaxID=328839 RepID=UPI0037580EC2
MSSRVILLTDLHRRTGLDQVMLSGGVALDCLANGRIHDHTPFKEAFIPPVPDDSGRALGSALLAHCQEFGGSRSYVMRHNYLRPGFADAEIAATLGKFGLPAERLANPAATAAELIANGRIIGWFQGRPEFGDRALGNRSILADPRDPAMKDKVNETVKYWESFRPFAPAILAEHAEDWFVGARPTRFMERALPVRPERRGQIPAVVHEDGTGRLQTVAQDQNTLFRGLIEEFHRRTGVPIVLNTSFNLKGEPIVASPQDTIRTFFSSGLDALVLGSFLLKKG